MQEEDLWLRDRLDLVIAWWPHFGTAYLADQLGLPAPQVKRQADALGLRRLPRDQRLCAQCRLQYQMPARDGLLCHDCLLLQRRAQRRTQPRMLEQWIREAVNVARHRSLVPCDLTTAYMVELWRQQAGRCFYSGRVLVPPAYQRGRGPFSASIDRLVPARGYTIGNVVWAAWVCNAGKNTLLVEEYVWMCAQVVRHRWTPLARSLFICGGQCPQVEQ